MVGSLANVNSRYASEYLPNKTKTDFDVIGISESRIKKNNCPINSINLKDYSYKSCPSESSAGGTPVIHQSSFLQN